MFNSITLEEISQTAENLGMPIESSFRSFFLSLLFAVLLLPAPAFAGDSEIYLEGVMYDAKKPSQSMASINGILVKQGDTIEDYTVKEVRETQVILTGADGKQKVLHITGGKVQAPKAVPAPASLKKNISKKNDEKTSEDLPGQLPFSINSMKKSMDQMQIGMNLRNLRSQAAAQMAATGHLPTIDELVENGSISPSFKGGVNGGYLYSLENSEKGIPVLFADPMDEKSPGLHYMLDEWGELHEENGKKANHQSPKANPLGGLGVS